MRMKEKHSRAAASSSNTYVLQVFFDNLRISSKNTDIQTKVITFDFEKTLQLHFLWTNEVYYSR